jgi:hypothetical protein
MTKAAVRLKDMERRLVVLAELLCVCIELSVYDVIQPQGK